LEGFRNHRFLPGEEGLSAEGAVKEDSTFNALS